MVIIIEVDNLVILQSAAPSGLLELPASAGVTLRSPPACGLATPSEFGFIFTNQIK